MRIRKRFPTIPSSPPPLLAPLTPPHPHITSITDSLHHHVDEETPLVPPAPLAPCNPPVTEEHVEPSSSSSRSDLQLILVKGSNGWVCKTDGDCMHQLNKEESSSLNAHTIHLSLSSSMGSFGAKEGHGIIASTSSSQQQDGDNTTTVEGVEGAMKKKRKKADKDSVMTEGARCSRVNGRGWRCCQPTLVGYSLCEHHTSKGRIRSSGITVCVDKAKEEKVGSSLSLSPSPSLSVSVSPSSSSISVNEEPLMKTSVHEEPLMKTIMKRKKKGGIGKARSMSSILGQTQPQCTPPLPIHIVDSVTGL